MRHRLRLAPTLAVLATAASLSLAPQQAAAQNGGLISTSGAYLAARAAALRFDLEAAAGYYRIVYDRNPSNISLASTIVSLWLEAGEIDEAVPLAQMIVATDPGYEPARLVLAAAAIDAGRFASASLHLGAIAGDSLSDVTAGILMAWMAAGQNQVEDALRRLDEMQSSELLQAFHAALIADLAGRSEEALSRLSQVYQPGSSQRLTEAYARLLARNGRTEEAEIVIEAFLADVPGHPILGRLLADIRSGAEIAPMVTSANQGAAELFYGLASSLVGGNDFETATIYLQFARYLGPAGDLPSVLLGQIFQAQRRHREAVAVFDTVPPESPFYVIAAIGASISDDARGRRDQAAARLEPVVAADPADVNAADTLAGIYRNQMRWADANAVLSATIASLEVIIPDDWRLFYQRGITFERLGQWAEAERDFRRALTLSPDEPDVLNYLGYSWIDRGENYLEALDMIERAVAQRPDSGYIIDSLGWAYYKLGDYAAAAETLERAAELTPNHAEVLEHLGDAYWRSGRRLEAVFQWNHALEFTTDEAALARLRDKIENGLPDVQEGGVQQIR